MAEDNRKPSRSRSEELASLGDDLLFRLGQARTSSNSGPTFSQKIKLPTFTPSTFRSLAVLAAMSALCGTGVIFLLNAAADAIEKGNSSAGLAILFVVVLLIYRYTEQVLVSSSCAAIEQALHKWRQRIADKVLRLSLRDVEDLGRGKLVDGLAKHYEQLSQTILPLVSGIESGILVVFMFAYLVSLSLIAGILTFCVLLGLFLGYQNTSETLKATMAGAANADARIARIADEIVHGFKELSLNRRKLSAIEQELGSASEDVTEQRTHTAKIFVTLITFADSVAYLLVAAVIFLLPILTGSHGSEISKIVMPILFILGPLAGVNRAVQQLATAQFTLQEIRAFEQEITERLVPSKEVSAHYGDFERLELLNVDYLHKRPDDTSPAFGVHNISFSVNKGQIVFITGGNGSGKTTVLRVLTGLYPVHGGHIELNGIPVSGDLTQEYRDLFSTVFADYHVFRKPYALDEAGLAELEALLAEFGIREKLPATLSDGYDPASISTGQRKRLALALAITENRPILIMDEWAADQDPATREAFYTTILPRLKAAGKTIIAVTHDDRYFNCADIRYHMQDGRLSQVTSS